MSTKSNDTKALATAMGEYLRAELLARGIRKQALPLLPGEDELLPWIADYFAEWIDEEDVEEIKRARRETEITLLRLANSDSVPVDVVRDAVRTIAELALAAPKDPVYSTVIGATPALEAWVIEKLAAR